MLRIALDLEEPRPAKSGKTMIIASSNGFRRSSATYDGKPVLVVVTACYEIDAPHHS